MVLNGIQGHTIVFSICSKDSKHVVRSQNWLTEFKLRVVYLLLMHQKLDKINYEDFNPGTGHSTRAIQGLMERLKKQYITDAKNGDAAATIASTPKKRGRPSKKAGEKTKVSTVA